MVFYNSEVTNSLVRTGEIVLSDVIDNDSWRLWEGGDKNQMRDKQIYRNLQEYSSEELKRVKLNYDWVNNKVADFCKASSNLVIQQFLFHITTLNTDEGCSIY